MSDEVSAAQVLTPAELAHQVEQLDDEERLFLTKTGSI